MEQLQEIKDKDGTIYAIGDIVCIYQGRFGHDNIITIKSIWKHNEDILVSSAETLPGTHLNAIKYKLSQKELLKIQKGIENSNYYNKFKII